MTYTFAKPLIVATDGSFSPKDSVGAAAWLLSEEKNKPLHSYQYPLLECDSAAYAELYAIHQAIIHKKGTPLVLVYDSDTVFLSIVKASAIMRRLELDHVIVDNDTISAAIAGVDKMTATDHKYRQVLVDTVRAIYARDPLHYIIWIGVKSHSAQKEYYVQLNKAVDKIANKGLAHARNAKEAFAQYKEFIRPKNALLNLPT